MHELVNMISETKKSGIVYTKRSHYYHQSKKGCEVIIFATTQHPLDYFLLASDLPSILVKVF